MSQPKWKLNTGEVFNSVGIITQNNSKCHNINESINREVVRYFQQVQSHAPAQMLGRETNITILLKDGTVLKAELINN